MSSTVYVSEYLEKTYRGKPVVKEFDKILGKRLKKIPDNKNEWCRDYMPVKASDGSLVLFKYMPSYMVGRISYEATVPEDREDICNTLGLEYEASDIILDGGAIEIFEDKAIISDRVISDNCSSWENEAPTVLQKIKSQLKLKTLIVVPSDPWDFTGHVDGMVRFIDGERGLVNNLDGLDKDRKSWLKYEKIKFEQWRKNFLTTLDMAGLIPVELPCMVHKNDKQDDATGIYLNYLHLEDMIIMPAYKDYLHQNDATEKKLGEVFGKPVNPVYADNIAKKGGVINCITWTK